MFDIEFEKIEEREILEAKVSGELTLESSKEISSKTRTKAKELDYGLLKDLSEVEQNVTLIDAYNFFSPSENKQLKPALKNVVTAVLVKDEEEKIWEFWELVSENNGLLSKVFDERSEALQWIETKRQKRKKVNN